MAKPILCSDHRRSISGRQAAVWLAVAGLAALWTLVVRGPYLDVVALDGDEALFLMIGKAWASGHPPYTVIWDLKPPGLYLIYAAVWSMFGDDLVGPKVACLAAVIATSLGLYVFAAWFIKSRRTGVAALLLYPPMTLVLDGLASKPDLLMTPFLAWGAVAAFASLRSRNNRSAVALAAGLLVGCAGMVKQTAAFEAAYFFFALAIADKGLGRRAMAFVAGCAFAPMLFVFWFTKLGLVNALFQGAVLSAFQRLGGDGVAFTETPVRFLAMLKPVLPLVIGAGLAWCERRRLVSEGRRAELSFIAGWAGASAAGAFVMRAMYAAYFQPLLPTLTLLTAAFLMLGIWPALTGRARTATAVVLAVCAIAYPMVFLQVSQEHRLIANRTPREIGAYLRHEALAPGDSIYVVDYEPVVYLLAGATAPTRFVLPQHLVCPFPASGVQADQEIIRIMASRPRCLVLAASRRRMACEQETLVRLPERLGEGHYTVHQRFVGGGEAVDVLCRQ